MVEAPVADAPGIGDVVMVRHKTKPYKVAAVTEHDIVSYPLNRKGNPFCVTRAKWREWLTPVAEPPKAQPKEPVAEPEPEDKPKRRKDKEDN